MADAAIFEILGEKRRLDEAASPRDGGSGLGGLCGLGGADRREILV